MIGMKAIVFFDTPKVQRAVDRGRRKALARAGAFVRQTAKQSIKKAPFASRKPRGRARTDFRRESSRPGRPPYSQVGTLKKFIYFGYDRVADGVLIGPVRLSSKQGDAPAALEHGGTTKVESLSHAKTKTEDWVAIRRPVLRRPAERPRAIMFA